MLVEDLEDELDLELSERDEDTIGGVVLSELGRRGRVGDVRAASASSRSRSRRSTATASAPCG